MFPYCSISKITKFPWYSSFRNARNRCNYPKDKKYKNYGGRGIKFKLTPYDMDKLWKRDKASNMQRPSIDRIDNDGDYEYNNCQFIEMVDNVKKRKSDNLKKRFNPGAKK